MTTAAQRIVPSGISAADWRHTPIAVRRAFEQATAGIDERDRRIEALEQRLAELDAENERLRERLSTSSRNSSKPPSSDPPSAPPRRRTPSTGRTRGGQPGHPGASRPLYPAEQCQRVVEHRPTSCADCGAALSGDDPEPLRHQVVEIPPVTLQIEEHRLHALDCLACGKRTRAGLPDSVEVTGYGPRLVSIVALLSGVLRSSVRKTQDAMRDLFGVRLATGTIALLRFEMSEAVRPAVEEAEQYVREAPVAKNADETGFRQGNADGANPAGRKAWLWVVVTPLVTVFRIFLSRDAAAAKALLGEQVRGVLTTDRYGAYGWVLLGVRQVCWAHLLREFARIEERGGESARIGAALLASAGRLFALWHRVRDGTLARSSFRQYLTPIRARIRALLEEGAAYRPAPRETSGRAKTARTCREILKVERALYLFARVEGVEPTNNAAERALRHAVVWRKVSFGSQSEAGSQFVARMMTVLQTLGAQERNVLEYLTASCQARREETAGPSLLPSEERAAHRIAA